VLVKAANNRYSAWKKSGCYALPGVGVSLFSVCVACNTFVAGEMAGAGQWRSGQHWRSLKIVGSRWNGTGSNSDAADVGGIC